MIGWWVGLSVHTRTVVFCVVMGFFAVVVVPAIAIYTHVPLMRWEERRRAERKLNP